MRCVLEKFVSVLGIRCDAGCDVVHSDFFFLLWVCDVTRVVKWCMLEKIVTILGIRCDAGCDAVYFGRMCFRFGHAM